MTLRQDNTLFVNVIEGKQLRNGQAKDPYCTIRFDESKDVVRTQTIYSTQTPLWGEEYHFEVYPNFQELNVTAFDNGTDSSKNDGRPIGKVCISRNALRRDPQESEQWFPLTRIEDYHSPGKVQVEMVKRKSKTGIDVDVTLLELRALDGSDVYSTTSTYFEVALYQGDRRVSQKLRTPTSKLIPQTLINETFEFHATDDQGLEVKIFYYKYCRWRPNILLGRCTLPLALIPLKVPHTCFYDLETKTTPSLNSGSLKLKYKYTEEFILPLQEYDELVKLLLDEDLGLIMAIGKLASDREDVARTLLRIFEGKNCTTKYVRSLYLLDIKHTVAANDVNLLFRGNSIGTKTVEMYMKLVGQTYLVNVLKPLIKSIYECQQSSEVDPSKIGPGEDIKANQEQLKKHLKLCLDLIFNSQCPPRFRELFHDMRKIVSSYFKEEKVPMHAVSGFLFLRFFCPAILSPKIFKIHDEHPTKQAKRALVLVAKHVQRIASLSDGGGKEDFLKESDETIESQRQGMYKFIDSLSTVPEELPQRIGLTVDLEKELACIHRHLNRTRDKLEKYHAVQDGHIGIDRVFGVLDQLDKSRDSKLSQYKANPTDDDARPRLRSMYTVNPHPKNDDHHPAERTRSASASLLHLDKIDISAVEAATAE